MSRVYVATSWKNELQPQVVAALRNAGFETYDFRNPGPASGFAWEQVDREWKDWGAAEFAQRLETDPRVAEAFALDKNALDWCDVCVLLLPSGRSAHLEAGWAAGRGKAVIVMLDAEFEHELMYLLLSGVGGMRFVTSTKELLAALRAHDERITPLAAAL